MSLLEFLSKNYNIEYYYVVFIIYENVGQYFYIERLSSLIDYIEEFESFKRLVIYV